MLVEKASRWLGHSGVSGDLGEDFMQRSSSRVSIKMLERLV